MDPQELLRRILEEPCEDEREELMQELAEWLGKGGFAPLMRLHPCDQRIWIPGGCYELWNEHPEWPDGWVLRQLKDGVLAKQWRLV